MYFKSFKLAVLAVLAIAAVAAWNVNLNSQKNELSDIQLANVEALAQESGEGQIYCCGSAGQCARTTTGEIVTGRKRYNPCNN
jgi:Tfp pilus assembly protein FimT